MIEKDNRILKESGITLVALVLTLILLLIMAVIIMDMVSGDNGIIEHAFKAAEAMNEAQAREKVQLEILASINPKTGELDREELKENLKEDLGIPDQQLQEDENGNLVFPVGDYDFEIGSEGKVDTSKSEGVPTPPQLEKKDITFINEPSKLTNTDVKVTIKMNIIALRLTLQYATEDPESDSSWQTYTEPVTMEDNGLIYARLINENGEKSNYIQGIVNNIDREEPIITGFEADEETLGRTSIQVTVTASDDRQLANEDTYKFFAAAEEEEEEQDFKLNGISTKSTYEYANLIPGKTYTLKVIVTDEAGNTAEEECEQKITMLKQLPELNEASQGQAGNITFKYSQSTWTNQDVNVKAESELLNEFKLQYSTNYNGDSLQNVTWQEYNQEEGFDIEENGKFAVRLKDDANPRKVQYGDPLEKKIDWIDKTDPEVMLETSDTTTNSTTIKVTATDEKDGSGLTATPYTYYLIEGEVTDPEQIRAQKGIAKEGPTNLSNYTYTGLTQNTKYTLVVDVEDVAGNITTTSTVEKTEEVPDISQEGKLTFKYSKEEWNNDDNVTVTLELASDINIDDFDLQYQTPNETNSEWTNYTKQGFQITKNGEINVRVKEKDGEQTGTTVTDSYNFFDRNAPKAEINVTKITKNLLMVQASATEDEEESGLHPTETYKFSIYQGSEIKPGSVAIEEKEASTEKEVTFSGLTAGTEYTVRVEVKDNASNIGTADVTRKTEDSTQVGINFVYYDEETTAQKTELVNGAIAEDDGHIQIKSPTVQNVKVNIGGKTITIIPKG